MCTKYYPNITARFVDVAGGGDTTVEASHNNADGYGTMVQVQVQELQELRGRGVVESNQSLSICIIIG
jgi:hypothetical protein